jgi:hypothetical protein
LASFADFAGVTRRSRPISETLIRRRPSAAARWLAVINGTLIAIQKFEIYSDGFAVDCTNTDDAKLVSDDIFRWAQTDLGYREFIRQPRLIYQSQITAEFDPQFGENFKTF